MPKADARKSHRSAEAVSRKPQCEKFATVVTAILLTWGVEIALSARACRHALVAQGSRIVLDGYLKVEGRPK